MAFPKLPLISLHLLVLCATVLGNEFEPLSWANSGLVNPSYPSAESPLQHHHFHHKISQAPVQSQTPVQPQTPSQTKPVQPQPPSQTPVKSQPPSQIPVKPQPPSKAPVKPQPPSKAPVKPQPPSKAPVKPQPPSKAPVKPQPPSQAPVKPVPKRSLVAVQGVVYCKPCKMAGVDTLLGATPLLGANVELHCNNTKYPKLDIAKTDKNGYFFMLAPSKLTTFGAHKCKAILGSSNNKNCSKPTNLHNGLQGAILRPQKQPILPKALPYQLYTVGPFAYESATKCAL